MLTFSPSANSFYIGNGTPPDAVAVTDSQQQEYVEKLKAGYTAVWTGSGWNYIPPLPGNEPSTHAEYGRRFLSRAAAKARIIAFIQADIDIRKLNGEFPHHAGRPEIMAIPEVQDMFRHLHSLSYGLAIEALMNASNPLLGIGLKADWISQINANMFNTGTPYTD